MKLKPAKIERRLGGGEPGLASSRRKQRRAMRENLLASRRDAAAKLVKRGFKPAEVDQRIARGEWE
jgi:hypothetical protein